ncbi:hypothetical protein [Candidatus Erwinia haradaeae]|uniref:hypothetical protein n=1 Tax=Candidatus Erwinia haradaeae TaxID=1922217 RepID=UPI00130083B7|nr:hypothetical protein [Candidatus Erwinia haradaeae]
MSVGPENSIIIERLLLVIVMKYSALIQTITIVLSIFLLLIYANIWNSEHYST